MKHRLGIDDVSEIHGLVSLEIVFNFNLLLQRLHHLHDLRLNVSFVHLFEAAKCVDSDWTKAASSLLDAPESVSSEAIALLRLEDEVKGLQAVLEALIELSLVVALPLLFLAFNSLACSSKFSTFTVKDLYDGLEADGGLELAVAVFVHSEDHLWDLDRARVLLLDLLLVLAVENDLE